MPTLTQKSMGAALWLRLQAMFGITFRRGDPMGALAVTRYAVQSWRPHLRAGSFLLVLLVVQQGYGVAIAYAMKSLVDNALPQRDSSAVLTILTGLAVAYV